MIGAFIFNGIESSSFNLVCKSVKRPLLPSAKVRRVELPGISGVYDFDEKDTEYNMRPLTMKIQYIGTSYEELRTRARQIAAWLGTGTWSELRIHDEDDKYYLAKVTGEIDLESLWESGTADIEFDCQPFAYSVDEEVEEFKVDGLTNHDFTNPGTRLINYKSPQGSKSKIKIVGAWTTLSVSMNGKTLGYPEAGNGTLIFDNVEMECTLGGVNKFSVLTGDVDTFLKIIPGDNTLTINGTGLDLDVAVEYIPLWI